jgi:hypothetical protein
MNRSLIAGALAAALTILAPGAQAQIPQSFTQQVLVPAYFVPGDPNDGHSGQAWSDLAASSAVGAIIFNPHNGPGDQSSVAVYRDAINAARAAGKKVIGYVSTSYSARPLADVMADIDSYYAWYVDGSGNPIIDGIFVDETQMHWPELNLAAWQADHAYYTAVQDAVRTRQATAFVVVNPGVEQHASIADVGDVVINFESSSTDFTTWSPPPWQADLPPSRSCGLVYGVASNQFASVINRGKSYNLGWIYVTGDTLDNPWDTLPPTSSWSAELTQVATTAAQVIPTALTAASASNDAGYLVFSMQHSFVVNNLTTKYRRVYLDTDRDVATGKPVGTVGADYLIENSWYYAWNGGSWTQVGPVTPSPNTASSTGWRINRRDVGSVTGPIRVKLELEEGSVTPARRRDGPLIELAADSLPPLPYTATNDSTKIYYSLTVAGTYTYRHVFIDTDQNAATGYVYAGIGAEYMIENGTLYHHAGGGWNWTSVGSANKSCTGNTCTWNILRSTVGETQPTGEASNVVFHAQGSSPEYLSAPYTHTFTP